MGRAGGMGRAADRAMDKNLRDPVTYRRRLRAVVVAIGMEVMTFALGVWNMVSLASQRPMPVRGWLVVAAANVILAFIVYGTILVIRDLWRVRQACRRVRPDQGERLSE